MNQLIKNVLILVAGVAGCSAVSAQTAATENKTSNTEELEQVVVTGTRVISNGNNSPTPVMVVTAEDLQATHPTTVFDALLDLPEFNGSRGTSATNPSDGGPNNGNASALGMRGMGPVRTLVLVDGRRLPATQANGFVDVNQIPQMLIQRVDVVTGGASAVYGSDAVAGVVNFVVDRKFNGLKADVKFGESKFNDDRSSGGGLAWGTGLFNGRGHFEASYNYFKSDGVPHRADREWFAPRYTVQGNGTTVPYFLTTNGTIAALSFGGKILNGPLINRTFNTNGLLSSFVNGTAIPGTTAIQIGGDGAYDSGTTLKAALDLNQFFARFDFDATDTTRFHLMASQAVNHSLDFEKDIRLGTTNANLVTLSATNGFLPSTYQQQLAAAGATTFTFGKMFMGYNPNGVASLVPTKNVEFFSHTLYLNTGLEGKLGSYDWDIGLTYGRATQHSRENANLNNGRLVAALDAIINPAGQVVCQVSTTPNAGLYPGCVPLNVFGPTSESQDAVNYVLQTTHYNSTNIMTDVPLLLRGSPFNDWAGPVDMALSAEWRRQTYEATSDALPVSDATLNCTGLRFNCTAGSTPLWNNNTYSNRPEVKQTVSEGAIEANVPLIRDHGWARSADINLAGRYASYRSQGNPIITNPPLNVAFNATTWKVGLNWHITDNIIVRATRSRDFRAPNLDELFGTGSSSFNSGAVDQLVAALPGATAGTQLQTGGNPLLRPEVGYTSTLGLVLKPTENFSVAMDGYRIKVSNYIQSVNGSTPAAQTTCYQSILAGSNSLYCSLQQRPLGLSVATINNPTLANTATLFYSRALNVALLETYGMDLEANYAFRLRGHPARLRALAEYQPHLLFYTPGSVIDGAGVLSQSSGVLGGTTGGGSGPGGGKVRVSLFARYALTDQFTVDWMTRWRSGLSDLPDTNSLKDGDPKSYAPALATTDLTLSYELNWRDSAHGTAYLSVLNLFNQPPSPVAVPGGAAVDPGLFGGAPVGDDPIGRSFIVGLRFRM